MKELKKSISLLLIISLLVGINTITVSSASTDVNARVESDKCTHIGSKMSAGITLDCARRYYSVDLIKKYIRFLSNYNSENNVNNFLQLHLSDNSNVGIVCDFLGQNEDSAILQKDGSYKNPATDKFYLEKEDINTILNYANAENVEIIPEIDMPAHMRGFYNLARNYYGDKYADDIFIDDDGEFDEIRIDSAGIDFAKKIYKEYADLFASCNSFHIGCDEYYRAGAAKEMHYINSISSYLKNKGFTVRIWNDLLLKKNYKKLNKDIKITYWSYDGDVEEKAYKKENRRIRASANQLIKAGYNIFIYNSYYLYYIPSKKNNNSDDNDYMVRDLKKHWSLKKWDYDTGKNLKNTKHVKGSSISVWGEDSTGVSDDDIYNETTVLYDAMCSKY